MGKRKAVHSEKEVPKVNKELSGFDIKINSFGEIITSYDLDNINDFLDKNVEDKKLKNRSEFLSKRYEDGNTEGPDFIGREDEGEGLKDGQSWDEQPD